MRDDAKAGGLVTLGQNQVNGACRLWVLYCFARAVLCMSFLIYSRISYFLKLETSKSPCQMHCKSSKKTVCTDAVEAQKWAKDDFLWTLEWL